MPWFIRTPRPGKPPGHSLKSTKAISAEARLTRWRSLLDCQPSGAQSGAEDCFESRVMPAVVFADSRIDLRRVLSLAIAEGPVFPRGFNQADHHVLRPDARSGGQILDDALIQPFLLRGLAARGECDLHEDNPV